MTMDYVVLSAFALLIGVLSYDVVGDAVMNATTDLEKSIVSASPLYDDFDAKFISVETGTETGTETE
jgi:hypothetical protein